MASSRYPTGELNVVQNFRGMDQGTNSVDTPHISSTAKMSRPAIWPRPRIKNAKIGWT